jgi:hypothetical protein
MKNVAATNGQNVSFATRFVREIAGEEIEVGTDTELNFC